MSGEIGHWTEIKLEIIREYATKYSVVLSAQTDPGFYHIYIDAFAGRGYHISRVTDEFVSGSPVNGLNVDPPFKEYHFIDLDGEKVEELRKIVGERDDVYIYAADCNTVLINDVFPRCKYEQYRRALCLLDPYSYDYEWRVVETAGRMRSIELFLNFPIWALNRNVFRKDPSNVARSQIEKLERFWPDDSYKDFYTSEGLLFKDIEVRDARNEEIVKVYCEKLREIATFEYIPEPLPMKNTKGTTVYYIIFAAHKPVSKRIVRHIFNRHRNVT